MENEESENIIKIISYNDDCKVFLCYKKLNMRISAIYFGTSVKERIDNYSFKINEEAKALRNYISANDRTIKLEYFKESSDGFKLEIDRCILDKQIIGGDLKPSSILKLCNSIENAIKHKEHYLVLQDRDY